MWYNYVNTTGAEVEVTVSKIIAIANQKGGVGKTTTTVNLAGYLAVMGKRDLILDVDPQSNASSGFGIDKKKLKNSSYSVLVGACEASQAAIHTRIKGLDIIPSNIDLAGAEIELVSLPNREKILKAALSRLRNAYDYMLIDCPPSLGLLTVNALTAADSVLIPIQVMNTIKLAKKYLNPQLEVEGVVLTMYDARSNLVSSVADEILKFFGKKVFNTRIPRSIRLAEAPSHGLTIMQYDPRSAGSLAYKSLCEELLKRNNDPYTPITNLRALKGL